MVEGIRYRYPTLEQLSSLIVDIQTAGYKFVGFNEYVSPSPDKKVLLTFDDGFSSIFQILHPFLMRERIPYLLAVLTAPLSDNDFKFGTTRLASGNRLFLTEEEILTLKNDGVHIAFHTRSHTKIVELQDVNQECQIPDE
jgi:peptidoglycan/xylan/chitin deacetylase (PgdA/CDA1 family)